MTIYHSIYRNNIECQEKQKMTRSESVEPAPGEGQMMLAELLLPMFVLFMITVCFIIVKKKRAKAVHGFEESDEELQ